MKELLVLDGNDSGTVRQLKQDCNQLIEQYNALEDPLQGLAQELITSITAYVTKIYQLKDSHYNTYR